MTLALSAAAACVTTIAVAVAARRRTVGVPLGASGSAATRTAATGAAAAALVIGLAVALAVLARPSEPPARKTTARAATVIAVDVSGSVTALAGAEVGKVVDGVSRRFPGRAGMVVFADDAAAILPASTPTVELSRLTRFLGEPTDLISTIPVPLENVTEYMTPAPWAAMLTGGTLIATGLRRAQELIAETRVSGGRIVLVSDLDDADPNGSFRAAMKRAERAGIDVLAVPVAATPQTVRHFRSLGGSILTLPSGTAAPQVRAAEPSDSRKAHVLALALLATLAGALLTAAHAWGSPLRLLPEPATGRGA